MPISRELLWKLLEELAEWLEFEDCQPVEWVVCGGMALLLQNLHNRATRDIDVLGSWNELKLEVTLIDDFSDKVKYCIEKVAKQHPQLSSLKTNWVNLGPSQLARWGLPAGFEKRLVKVKVSDKLILQLLSRQDLLPLKLYAASDDHGPRQTVYFGDLKVLNPTFDELDKAVDWVRTLPDFEEIRPKLKDVTRGLGYDDLASYI